MRISRQQLSSQFKSKSPYTPRSVRCLTRHVQEDLHTVWIPQTCGIGNNEMVLALFWAFAVLAIGMPIRILVYGLFASMSLGTIAVVPLTMSGGINLIPPTILSSLLIVRLILKSDPAAVWDAALDWRHLGILIAFMLYAILLTGVAPRLFAGVPTMGLNIQQAMPLAPGTGNLTQGLYLTNSCLMTLAMYLLLSDEGGREIFRKGLIIGGMAVVLSGVADIVTYGSNVLEPLRTAGYAMLTNADMAGTRRVVGLQPEASSFGYVTLSFGAMIVLMRPAAMLDRAWRWLAPLTGWACLTMAAMSTSSGALSGLLVFLLVLTSDTIVLLMRGQGGSEAGRLVGNLTVLAGLAIAAGLMMTVLPGVGAHLLEIFDAAVVQKTTTGSFEERLYWNTVSLEGFFATGGVGLGVGSTRASSWIVALVCGTGVIGTALLGLFLLNVVFQPIARAGFADRLLVAGAKRSLLISMVPFAGSATSVDFGLQIAVLFAVLTAIPAASAPERPVPTIAARYRGRAAPVGRVQRSMDR